MVCNREKKKELSTTLNLQKDGDDDKGQKFWQSTFIDQKSRHIAVGLHRGKKREEEKSLKRGLKGQGQFWGSHGRDSAGDLAMFLRGGLGLPPCALFGAVRGGCRE